jgi:glycosyltransferase involved in cell wall biosynthesis
VAPRYRVLILNLNKPGFLEDVTASFAGAKDFELVSWPTYALTSFSAALLAPELSNKTYESDDPVVEASKLRYRDFLFALWSHFTRREKIDAVLTANYGYYNQREFAAALNQAATPFIALHKENVKSPGRVKYWQPIYRKRGRFEGSKILVYSETERDLQVSSGVTDAANVVVAGMPRLDRVHHMRSRLFELGAAPPPQLLFFAFWKREKLTATERVSSARLRMESDEEWSLRNWNALCEGTYRAIVELARSRPDARVVMKTKPQSVRLEEILKMLGETADTLPSNFEIVTGGDPIRLIGESRVVVGFNSTALLEALAAGKPVIVPDFAEARDPAMRDLVIDLGEAVEKASSPEELSRSISRHLDAETAPAENLTAVSLDTLRQWVGNDDGAAGQRVLAAIRAEIARTSDAERRGDHNPGSQHGSEAPDGAIETARAAG